MKSGRLFWKLFLAFWLAQIATAVGVGAMIWAHRLDHVDERPPPPPEFHDGARGGRAPPHRPGPPPRSIFPPLMPVVVGGIVSLVFAWLLAAYLSRPIRTLHEAFEAGASGRLDTRIGARMGRRRDELAALGSDFDRMAERLQHLVESQRRLLHDVSHELRSPLARLQAASELLQQQPERAHEFIARIQRDTGRVDALVGELLTLSRLDGGTESLRLEPFDPDELVADIVADVSFEAEMKGCRVELRSETDMQIAADLEFSRRAIENVLRNAIRHAPPGSVVGITVAAAPGRLLITIRDRGAGVPEAELETIFQPFHRAENARPFEGYGLGLAITRQVMKRHGGDVHAANRTGGGLEVTLAWPVKAE